MVLDSSLFSLLVIVAVVAIASSRVRWKLTDLVLPLGRVSYLYARTSFPSRLRLASVENLQRV
jgi:hypothetical protein